jgi:hypothetical protein
MAGNSTWHRPISSYVSLSTIKFGEIGWAAKVPPSPMGMFLIMFLMLSHPNVLFHFILLENWVIVF